MHMNAVEDEAAHTALREAADKRLIDNERVIGEQITEILTKTVRNVDYRNLALPIANYRQNKVGLIALDEAIVDQLNYSIPIKALMVVYAHSDCPLVAAFRDVIAESYKDNNAADIAELTQ